MARQQSEQARAAAMIRKHLKAHGIVATVRSGSASMMTEVTVSTVDLLPGVAREIERYVRQFQYGTFDGMTDCYEYSNQRDDIPQVKYASYTNRFSDGVRQRAWDWLRGYMAGFEDAPESEADAWQFDYHGRSGAAYLHQYLNDPQSPFWRASKPRVRAAA